MNPELITQILLIVAISSIVILLLFLLLLFVRQPQGIKIKNDKFSLEELTFSPIFKKIIDALIPAAEEREYRKNERLISDSGCNISMRVLYFFKLVLPIIILIVLTSIVLINRQTRVNAIITGKLVQNVNMIGADPTSSKSTMTNSEKRALEKAKKDTYAVMNKFVNSKIVNTKDAVVVKQMLQEAFVNNNISSETDAIYDASEMYNTMVAVEAAKRVNPITIIFIFMTALVGFYLPNVFLVISRMIRYQSFDNEVIALEMLTIMVGSIENVTVKEVLRILSLNSKAFKPNFEKALLEYPIDFEQALINLGDSSKNKDFQALVSTLRQCATSDKYSALQTLQRRRISRKEYRKLMEEKKIETKMYIAFIMLLPVLFFLAKLLLSPWSELMNTSGLL